MYTSWWQGHGVGLCWVQRMLSVPQCTLQLMTRTWSWLLLVMGSQNVISSSMCTTTDDKDMEVASVGNGITECDQYLNVHNSWWQGMKLASVGNGFTKCDQYRNVHYTWWQEHGVGFCWQWVQRMLSVPQCTLQLMTRTWSWLLLVMGSQNVISSSMCTTTDDKDMEVASVGNGITEYDQYLNVHNSWWQGMKLASVGNGFTKCDLYRNVHYTWWQGHGVGFCWEWVHRIWSVSQCALQLMTRTWSWFLLVMGSQNVTSTSMCTTAGDKDIELASVGNGFTECDQYLNVH